MKYLDKNGNQHNSLLKSLSADVKISVDNRMKPNNSSIDAQSAEDIIDGEIYDECETIEETPEDGGHFHELYTDQDKSKRLTGANLAAAFKQVVDDMPYDEDSDIDADASDVNPLEKIEIDFDKGHVLLKDKDDNVIIHSRISDKLYKGITENTISGYVNITPNDLTTITSSEYIEKCISSCNEEISRIETKFKDNNISIDNTKSILETINKEISSLLLQAYKVDPNHVNKYGKAVVSDLLKSFFNSILSK